MFVVGKFGCCLFVCAILLLNFRIEDEDAESGKRILAVCDKRAAEI